MDGFDNTMEALLPTLVRDRTTHIIYSFHCIHNLEPYIVIQVIIIQPVCMTQSLEYRKPCVCFPQHQQRTYDYVLVADKVEDQEHPKFLKQVAFIDHLRKKNMKVTVSLLLD